MSLPRFLLNSSDATKAITWRTSTNELLLTTSALCFLCGLKRTHFKKCEKLSVRFENEWSQARFARPRGPAGPWMFCLECRKQWTIFCFYLRGSSLTVCKICLFTPSCFFSKGHSCPKRANVSYTSVILFLLYREFYNSSQCAVLKGSLETKLDVGGIVIFKKIFLKTLH